MDEAESQSVLADERYAGSVRTEEQEWLSRGIQGVPTFIVNNKYAVSGAQEPKALADMIMQAASES